MNLDRLVDEFVVKISTKAPADASLDEVPVQRRVSAFDAFGEEDFEFTGWKVIASDHASRCAGLVEQRKGRAFSPSFRNLICQSSFPAFELEPIVFLANMELRLLLVTRRQAVPRSTDVAIPAQDWLQSVSLLSLELRCLSCPVLDLQPT